MKVILASIVLTSLDLAAASSSQHSPLFCSICGARHGNLIGNGICLDCNKREFGIRPDGTVPVRIRR